MQALWAIALATVLWFILNRHRFGEHILFIGDNASVATVVGVNVSRERVKLFLLMGTLAGFAAVLLTLENRNFFNTQGQGYLLIALASVFIGGADLQGPGDHRRDLLRGIHHLDDRGWAHRDRDSGLLGARRGRARVPRGRGFPSDHGAAAAPCENRAPVAPQIETWELRPYRRLGKSLPAGFAAKRQ